MKSNDRSVELTNQPPDQGVRRFGNYQLLGEIARGGMGVVYKARQDGLNRDVALKMIKAGQLAGDEEVRRFHAEAEAAAKLDHPNIVPIYEVGEADNLHFFSMAFVEGQGLDARLKDGPLPPREAADVIGTIAEAVQYAHDRGIVHRDLKPANVLIDTDDKPRITDFGLAKNIAGDSGMTATGQVMGTPSYMAPEQAAGKTDEIGPLADVYSLGAMFYALLTGRPPFQAANVMETLKQVCEQEPVSPRTLNPAIDRDLETICLKCLEKERTRRYESAREFAEDLQRYLEHKPILSRPLGRMERAWRWCRRHPARAGVLMLSILTFAALAAAGVAIGYQGELETANSELETVNTELAASLGREQSSLEREKGLTAQLQQALGDEEKQRIAAQSIAKAEASARLTAESEKKKSQQLKDDIDQLLSIRRVNLALALWKDDQPKRARKLLDDCPPEHRKWEWHYAYNVCHPEIMELKGQTNPIACVAFSTDGKRLLTGSEGNIRMWNPRTGGEYYYLIEGQDTMRVSSVAFSPDGQQFVSGGSRIVMWRSSDGRKLRVFDEDAQLTSSVIFSPDGTKVVAAGERIITLWDVSTGERIREFSGHSDVVSRVLFSPDGCKLISSSADATIKLWNLEDGHEVSTLRGHTDAVTDLAVSVDGKLIASGSRDQTVRIWDASTGSEIRLIRHDSPIATIALSPDSRYIVAGGNSNDAVVWKVETGIETKRISGHGGLSSITFSPDGRTIAGGGVDKLLRFWPFRHHDSPTLSGMTRCLTFSPNGEWIVAADSEVHILIDTGREVMSIREGIDSADIRDVSFSPDGRSFATAGKRVVLWDLGGRKLISLQSDAHQATCVAYSPNGTRIATGSEDGAVRLWEIKTGKVLRKFTGHTLGITSLVFSPDGRSIVSGGHDKTVRIWNTAGESNVHLWTGHADSITALAYDPHGRTIVAGCRDGAVKTWDVQKDHHALTLRLKGPVLGVSFTADGSHVIAGSAVDIARMWDSRTGRMIKAVRQSDIPYYHRRGISSIAFSDDGNDIALNGQTGIQILDWNANKPKPNSRISPKQFDRLANAGRTGIRVNLATLSPDGKHLLYSLNRNDVVLWDIEANRQVWTHKLPSGSRGATSMTFSQDGRIIAMTERDGSLRLWDTRTGRELSSWQVELSKPAKTDKGSEKIVLHNLRNVGFLDEGRMLCCFGQTGPHTIATTWQTETAQKLSTHQFERPAKSFSFYAHPPDGRRNIIAHWNSAGNNLNLSINDATTGRTKVVSTTFSRIHCYSFSATGKNFAAICSSTSGKQFEAFLVLWDSEWKEKRYPLKGFQQQYVLTDPKPVRVLIDRIAISPDGNRVVLASRDGDLTMVDTRTGISTLALATPHQSESADREVIFLQFAQDGTSIVAITRGNKLLRWSTRLSPKTKVLDQSEPNTKPWIATLLRKSPDVHPVQARKPIQVDQISDVWLPIYWRQSSYKRKIGNLGISRRFAKSGRESAKVIATTDEPDDIRFVQMVNVREKQWYHLSGWIKTVNVKPHQGDLKIGANLSILDSVERTPTLIGNNDWTFVATVFQAQKSERAAVAARLGFYGSVSSGTAWFDDLCLIPIEVPSDRHAKMFQSPEFLTKTRRAKDLLRNPDFEVVRSLRRR